MVADAYSLCFDATWVILLIKLAPTCSTCRFHIEAIHKKIISPTNHGKSQRWHIDLPIPLKTQCIKRNQPRCGEVFQVPWYPHAMAFARWFYGWYLSRIRVFCEIGQGDCIASLRSVRPHRLSSFRSLQKSVYVANVILLLCVIWCTLGMQSIKYM